MVGCHFRNFNITKYIVYDPILDPTRDFTHIDKTSLNINSVFILYPLKISLKPVEPST